MPRPKQTDWRHDPEILKRLPQVEDLHLMGYPNTRIAQAMKVTEGTIRQDLKRIAALWLERAGDSIVDQKARSVAVYRKVQRQAWQEIQSAAKHEEQSVPDPKRGASVRDLHFDKSSYLNAIKGAEDSITKVLHTTEEPLLPQTDIHVHVSLFDAIEQYAASIRAASRRSLPPGIPVRDGADESLDSAPTNGETSGVLSLPEP